ncbi:hypothetical protein BKA69DRAFT_1036422 [Paraphysoderma sedebokerense]|nr:hypothetical protein BKA69DRAFT_1036422 [Paraphysoderma sedebokerense]
MSLPFTHSLARIIAAQILHQQGFHGMLDSTTSVLSDIMLRYLELLATHAKISAELCGRSNVNFSDVNVVFKRFNIKAKDLKDFVDAGWCNNSFALGEVPEFPTGMLNDAIEDIEEYYINGLSILERLVEMSDDDILIVPSSDEPTSDSGHVNLHEVDTQMNGDLNDMHDSDMAADSNPTDDIGLDFVKNENDFAGPITLPRYSHIPPHFPPFPSDPEISATPVPSAPASPSHLSAQPTSLPPHNNFEHQYTQPVSSTAHRSKDLYSNVIPFSESQLATLPISEHLTSSSSIAPRSVPTSSTSVSAGASTRRLTLTVGSTQSIISTRNQKLNSNSLSRRNSLTSNISSFNPDSILDETLESLSHSMDFSATTASSTTMTTFKLLQRQKDINGNGLHETTLFLPNTGAGSSSIIPGIVGKAGGGGRRGKEGE